MNRKAIKKKLSSKFDEFVCSIQDESVAELVRENTIISGGCITSMLLNEEVNDYDLYFADFETAKAVANYYIKLFNRIKDNNTASLLVEGGRIKIYIKSDGVSSIGDGKEDVPDFLEVEDSEEEEDKYKPVFLTSNAITLSDGLQLVIRFYGNGKEIHENFDFIHTTCCWMSGSDLRSNGELHLPARALEAIINKELVYKGSLYPLCSLFRIRKFIERGWTINAGQILKIAMQLNNYDLTDIQTLEDQLIGVDYAYFNWMIDLIKEEQRAGNIEDVKGYVFELVDELF